MSSCCSLGLPELQGGVSGKKLSALNNIIELFKSDPANFKNAFSEMYIVFRSGSQADLNSKFESLLESSGITKVAYPENIDQAGQVNVQLVTRMRLMFYYKFLASGRSGK